MGVRHLLAAAGVLATSSCLLPEYQTSSVVACKDAEAKTPFTKLLGSGAAAWVTDIDGDPCSKMYASGMFYWDIQFDTSLTFEGPEAESYIAQLEPNGDYAWVRQIGGDQDQWTCCVASTPTGVVAAGDFEINVAFESQVLFEPGVIDQFHGFLLKVTADGSLAGSRWLQTPSHVSVVTLDTNSEGRVAVGGWFRDGLTVDGTGVSLSNGDGTEDGYVLVFDRDLALLWSVQVGTPGNDHVSDVAYAEDGSLYVAGVSDGNPFWQAYSPDGAPQTEQVHTLAVGGGVERARIVPLAGTEFIYVMDGGEYISDGTMEWPMTHNIGAMRLDAQGGVQWHLEIPDVDSADGITPDLEDVHYDALGGYVHLIGTVHGGQANVVQDGQVAVTLDPPAIWEMRDALLVTLHVETGFLSATLFGDGLGQEGNAVFGASGQVFLGGEFEGSIEFPAEQRVSTESSTDGFLVRFPWPGP